jgi:hypothetical protein
MPITMPITLILQDKDVGSGTLLLNAISVKLGITILMASLDKDILTIFDSQKAIATCQVLDKIRLFQITNIVKNPLGTTNLPTFSLILL